MADDKRTYFAEYDSLVADASQSVAQQFGGNTGRWLHFIETTPPTDAVVSALGQNLGRDDWIKCYATTGVAMGGGNVSLPLEKQPRLGAQLDLMRIFARGEWEPFQLALATMRTGQTNFNALTQLVVRQIFQPLARDLRRYIDENWPAEPTQESNSERVVRLNHDSDVYREAIESLNTVRDAVARSNSYNDPIDKAQQLAELSASRQLLDAPQVRADAIRSLPLRCLRYLRDRITDGVVSALIEAAIKAILALIT
jgi:hypothetical protein